MRSNECILWDFYTSQYYKSRSFLMGSLPKLVERINDKNMSLNVSHWILWNSFKFYDDTTYTLLTAHLIAAVLPVSLVWSVNSVMENSIQEIFHWSVLLKPNDFRNLQYKYSWTIENNSEKIQNHLSSINDSIRKRAAALAYKPASKPHSTPRLPLSVHQNHHPDGSVAI